MGLARDPNQDYNRPRPVGTRDAVLREVFKALNLTKEDTKHKIDLKSEIDLIQRIAKDCIMTDW